MERQSKRTEMEETKTLILNNAEIGRIQGAITSAQRVTGGKRYFGMEFLPSFGKQHPCYIRPSGGFEDDFLGNFLYILMPVNSESNEKVRFGYYR